MVTNNDEVMTLEELAKFLKVHYQTARGLLKSKKIPSAKIGRDYRVLKSDVIKYIEKLKNDDI